VIVAREGSTEHMIDTAVRDLDLPEECLIAILRRGEESLVPRGTTVLRQGDQLTILGSRDALVELRARYGVG